MNINKLYSGYPNSKYDDNSKCLGCKRMHCELRIIDNQVSCADCYQKIPNLKLLQQVKDTQEQIGEGVEIKNKRQIPLIGIVCMILGGIIVLSAIIVGLVIDLDVLNVI